MRCEVFGCNNHSKYNNNNDNKISFFRFPTDMALQRKWIAYCRRKDIINVKDSRICCAHFCAEDFENEMKYQMGFAKLRLLKATAYPSVSSQPPEKTRRDVKMEERNRAELARNILREAEERAAEERVAEERAAEERAAEERAAEEVHPVDDQPTLSPKEMQEEIDLLTIENARLKANEAILAVKLAAAEQKLAKANYENANMQSKLRALFTEGQIKKLCNGVFKKQMWAEEDIARSMSLYCTSSRAYNLLRHNNFPLPGVCTLQKWSQKVDISVGVLKPVLKIMSEVVDLNIKDKICVLSFDEMKIRETYCYDKPTDSTFSPAKYVQVAMLRGLICKWKQPIFYDFDCKMSTEILKNIISEAKKCGYNVVAMVCDLGGSNRGLLNELQVTMEKPWFLHEGEKVFAFADVPHMMKLLRNHFIDTGFVIDGKLVTKQVIVELLSVTSSELSITHKISARHLNVHGAERQKVKLATKLFSHTIAQATTRAASLGLLKSNNWEQCHQLFKLTNDWFDVQNVRVPTDGARKRRHGYGLALELQNEILDNMSYVILEMRAPNKKSLLPFQKGIIQSNNALKLLHRELEERFGIQYILTYRLNQDVLEIFFGIMRSKGGLHDHPNRQEFQYRLRSYIVGHNEGAISKEMNVSQDDTPDLEGVYQSLAGRIIRSSTRNNNATDNEEEDIADQEGLENYGLENLAGYVCHRLRHELPEMRVGALSDVSFTWLNHVSEGGLSKPTDRMMGIVKQLREIFLDLNGDGLVISCNYLKKHLDSSENVNCDINIKKICLRSMMYLRIRVLNRNIVITNTSRKRKLTKTITYETCK